MSEANATLKEAFRHHAWATRELLAFCTQLRPEQLSQPPRTSLAGDHGSILETFDHIVCTDGGYLGALTGHRPAWAHERGLSSDLRQPNGPERTRQTFVRSQIDNSGVSSIMRSRSVKHHPKVYTVCKFGS